MHSTASDGALAPAELMARAAAAGVELVALTDHDCVDGLPEARAAATAHGMAWVSGVELSAQWQGHTIHILGYGFDSEAPTLVEALAGVRDGRWQRAEQIAARLAAKRMPGALEGALAVQQATGSDPGSPPARPHFADWMVEAGYVRDRGEAFRKWLGAGKLGDIKQHWPTLATAVAQLRDAGGLAVLAHPWHYGFTRARIRRLLRDFAEAGGRGIEVVNGKQPPEQVAVLARMASEFGFLASAGSDFHHPDSPWMALGQMTPLPAECTPIWQDARFSGGGQ
ncbi:PHP-like protein [Pseudomonas saudimassiliensis]|uniref:PHP-like protein n=2 Tax=Pseudomonas saudimassiliensis TaxID=1461581 RepID=A0A078M8F8_9PSED|nr:PHP-like protein [Pseudomonas saudimassiliensis]CEF25585.1 PHP-like protein [Pseudomonas saudimassiliensis]